MRVDAQRILRWRSGGRPGRRPPPTSWAGSEDDLGYLIIRWVPRGAPSSQMTSRPRSSGVSASRPPSRVSPAAWSGWYIWPARSRQPSRSLGLRDRIVGDNIGRASVAAGAVEHEDVRPRSPGSDPRSATRTGGRGPRCAPNRRVRTQGLGTCRPVVTSRARREARCVRRRGRRAAPRSPTSRTRGNLQGTPS